MKDDWGVSDHNPIRISMYDEPIDNSVRATVLRWYANECDWKAYGCRIESLALRFGYNSYLALSAKDKIEKMYEWIETANDAHMKRACGIGSSRKSVVWWNDELASKGRETRVKRDRYQRERLFMGDPERVKWSEYRACMHEYKRMIRDAK